MKAIFLFHDDILPLVKWWKWYLVEAMAGRDLAGPVQNARVFGKRRGIPAEGGRNLAGFHMLYDRRPNFPEDSVAAEGTLDFRSHGQLVRSEP